MTETYYHLSTFSLEYISLESLQNIGDRLSIIFIFRIGISKYFVGRVNNNPDFIFCVIMKFAKNFICIEKDKLYFFFYLNYELISAEQLEKNVLKILHFDRR